MATITPIKKRNIKRLYEVFPLLLAERDIDAPKGYREFVISSHGGKKMFLVNDVTEIFEKVPPYDKEIAYLNIMDSGQWSVGELLLTHSFYDFMLISLN